MRTVAIIQARMGSTRLPGKVLRPIAGQPMIDHVVTRARHIPGIDHVGVATSTSDGEAPLIAHLESENIPYIRGSEQDVLTRYVQAAHAFGADRVMRITSDCPLLDPAVSERVLKTFDSEECDYASNTMERTWPRGLDTEVLTVAALRDADDRATTKADREHVTRHIWRHPERYQIRHVTQETDASNHRWTVDEADDLQLVLRIYEAYQDEKSALQVSAAGDIGPTYEDVLQILAAYPEWNAINRHIEQKKC